MPKFSANLGFLWADIPLPDAIYKAAESGFDAVECHWPYHENLAAIRAALNETGLPMLGINTSKGEGADMLGLCALANHEKEARESIDQALEIARLLDVKAIHVMAGRASGKEARNTFIDNLLYACEGAALHGKTILIEPLNPHDAPGYFHATTDQAISIIQSTGMDNLKLMFDCYHVARTEASGTDGVIERLQSVLPYVGHIQFASAPDRGTPDHGDVDYATVFQAIDDLDWHTPLGAEYKPNGRVEDGLGWMF